MFVTKTRLSRRTVLKGFATALALPFLDAMTPAFARAQDKVAAPLRFGGVYVPNGAPIGTGVNHSSASTIVGFAGLAAGGGASGAQPPSASANAGSRQRELRLNRRVIVCLGRAATTRGTRRAGHRR